MGIGASLEYIGYRQTRWAQRALVAAVAQRRGFRQSFARCNQVCHPYKAIKEGIITPCILPANGFCHEGSGELAGNPMPFPAGCGKSPALISLLTSADASAEGANWCGDDRKNITYPRRISAPGLTRYGLLTDIYLLLHRLVLCHATAPVAYFAIG